MRSTTIEDLPLLMALRVQGISGPERAAAAAGIAADTAAAALERLAAGGLATERSGRAAGYTLTANGSDALEVLLAGEDLRGCVPLRECYERFLQLNTRVLKLSSEWQLRREGGTEVPNDHGDASYDASVIDRLADLHARASACLEAIARCAPRFAAYSARLDSCVERLSAGDVSAFTAPLAESYHTVWFELHQDLLLTLGLEREE